MPGWLAKDADLPEYRISKYASSTRTYRSCLRTIWVRVEHLIARVEEREEELPDRRFPSRLDRDVLHGVVDATGGTDICSESLTQLGYPGVGCVPRLAPVQSRQRSVDHGRRR
jgi:hypothetical protein